MAQRVGFGLVLDLLKTPAAGSGAAAIVTATLLSRQGPAFCLERSDDFDIPWGSQRGAVGDADSASLLPADQVSTALLGEPELKSVSSVFSYGNLLFTAGRSLLLNLLPLWNEYFQAVENAEEEAFAQGLGPPEWPPWPWAEMEPAYWRSLWAALRDLATFAVRRLYEAQADFRAPRHVRNQLLADTRKTAVVLAKTTPVYRYIPLIASTAFKGNLLGAAADCTVSVGIDCYRVILAPAYRKGRRPTLNYGARRLGRIVAANLLRCSTGLCAASVGVSVGAYTTSYVGRPSIGAIVGATAAEFAWVVLVVAPLVNGWAYGPDEPDPPRHAAPPAGATPEGELPNDDQFELAPQ
mmetsp:Transcript_692/g.2019  ORF Transcript_692/g.2019 Transcript_692/m.2019 type:complete len:353 (-) Transcript_692:263-1321(-)